jgi:hypothetical protein
MTKLGNPETPATFQETPMTPGEPKPANFTVRSSASPFRHPSAKESSARSPKPLRRWSVAELVARAAVRRPMTA